MDNLMYSLNATVPIFLMMVLGYIFHKIGWMDDQFVAKMNKFVFVVPLPALLFRDLSVMDIVKVWDTKFVLYCFFVTLFSIMISFGISCLWKDEKLQGEFIQASYRSSAAILGVALIQNMYGTSGMAPLMMIGSVPLYNIMAVIVLSVFNPKHHGLTREALSDTVKGVATNPIILGIIVGMAWSLLKIPMPGILHKTVSNVAAMATPMGLMAMGANFRIDAAFEKAKPALTASFLKLLGFCLIFLPLAIIMGFRTDKLMAILIMLGSATTVSSYVMAKNMGHEGVLSSSVVMLTTLFSAFTLTGWIYLLKIFNCI